MLCFFICNYGHLCSSFWILSISKPATNLLNRCIVVSCTWKGCALLFDDITLVHFVWLSGEWFKTWIQIEASFLSQNILEQWRWCLWCNFHWVMFIQVSNGNGLEATKNHYPSNSDTLSWNLLSSNTFLPISVSFLIDLFLFSDGNNYAFITK